MSNYLFLDIDGVLNNQNSFLFEHHHTDDNDRIDRRSLHILKILCHQYDVKVVMSSSWRRSFDDNMKPKKLFHTYFDGTTAPTEQAVLYNLFQQEQINLIGKTDTETAAGKRWDRDGQILRYVEANLSSEDKWAVLDDEAVFTSNQDGFKHFVQTNFYGNGLDYEHYEKLVQIFEGE